MKELWSNLINHPLTTILGILTFIGFGVEHLYPEYAIPINTLIALGAGSGLIVAKDPFDKTPKNP